MMIAYELGCSYFHISHPFELAEQGTAIMSSFSAPEFDSSTILFEDIINNDLSKSDLKVLNLNDKIYEEDTGTIKADCTCYACSNNYTKAYIHHLLKCKEINATILIIL
jgi:tRNA-guanine family transglycosylase